MDGQLTAEQQLEQIKQLMEKVTSGWPPFYLYGDNEAACWMAEQLQQLNKLL